MGATFAEVNIAGFGGGFGGQGGGQVGGAGGVGQGGISFLTATNTTAGLADVVRLFFLTAGVDLSPPKTVFFNERNGIIYVRAALQDLDIIEQAIQVLNQAPPQLTIEAKFAEITQDDTRALGLDWWLGNILFNHGAIGAQAGTAPSFQGTPTTANGSSGFFPGYPTTDASGNNLFKAPANTDQLLTGGLRNQGQTLATVTGILTDPQFRVAIKALEQRQGIDLLSAPKVTTLSGRQTQIKVVDVKTYVAFLDTGLTAGGGGLGAGGAGGATTTGNGVVGGQITPGTDTIEVGPVLDVIPYVAADGYTIHMTIMPTLKEFLGYDDPGQFVAQIQSVSGTGAAPPLLAPTPLPKFRLRQVATSCTVWDGQTVVLGGLISEDVQKIKDKVPVPTIIDPGGNRVHSDEEMPFGQQPIPVQMGTPPR
ncbi:MAG: hypothetical protein DME26_12220 [Verrucomicrobia bacterium]|nr:MAG: hypothetical protein DME26_12220 [Verrucomicrobiota bacterium]